MASFKANPNFIPYLKRSPQLLAVLKLRAEEAAERAKAIAPFDPSDSGEHYRDMIEADAGIVNGQVTGRVNANKWTSGFIEFGTQGSDRHHATPAFAVLRRAVESLGLRFISKGRK